MASADALSAAQAETASWKAESEDLRSQLGRSEFEKGRLEEALGLAAKESARLHGEVAEARETLELCRLDLEAAVLEKESAEEELALVVEERRGGGFGEGPGREADGCEDLEAEAATLRAALGRLKALGESEVAAAGLRLEASEAAFGAARADCAWRAAHEAEWRELTERKRDDLASLDLVESLSARNLDLEDQAERLSLAVQDLERERDLAQELDDAQADELRDLRDEADRAQQEEQAQDRSLRGREGDDALHLPACR